MKTRTGWDRGHKNGIRIARIAEDCGIQALAIHGRTRTDLYQGEAEHETVRGDQGERPDSGVRQRRHRFAAARAREMLDATGCDGVMIGRAAQGRPWIFDEVNFFLATGELRADACVGKSP